MDFWRLRRYDLATITGRLCCHADRCHRLVSDFLANDAKRKARLPIAGPFEIRSIGRKQSIRNRKDLRR